MALFTDKIVFCHMPHTGGTWFREQVKRRTEVWEVGSPHACWKDVEDAIGDRTPVSICRDPYEWLYAAYHWLRKGKMKCTTEQFKILPEVPRELYFDGLRFTSWEVFFQDYIEKSPGLVTRIFGMYDHPKAYRVNVKRLDEEVGFMECELLLPIFPGQSYKQSEEFTEAETKGSKNHADDTSKTNAEVQQPTPDGILPGLAPRPQH